MTLVLQESVTMPKDTRLVMEDGRATPAFVHYLGKLEKLFSILGATDIPDVKALAFLDTLPLSYLEAGALVRVDDGEAVVTLTDYFPAISAFAIDDTIMQIGEGTEVFALPYTPVYADSLLTADITLHVGSSTGACVWAAGLFSSQATDDAVGMMAGRLDSATVPGTFAAQIPIPNWGPQAGSLSLRIARAGAAGGYPNINGIASARVYGGALVTRMEIQEWRALPLPEEG